MYDGGASSLTLEFLKMDVCAGDEVTLLPAELLNDASVGKVAINVS